MMSNEQKIDQKNKPYLYFVVCFIAFILYFWAICFALVTYKFSAAFALDYFLDNVCQCLLAAAGPALIVASAMNSSKKKKLK